ncbi:MAG: tetratricopeptide repeat protein [Chthonomonadaceae bacterium]|nr:tetratricopeptide repeat protein [Chthonomonadaceae bacterium]
MENSKPKPENTLQAEASESKVGSVEAVASRLLRWGRIAPTGLARVEYISETSQMAAIRRLCDGFQQLDIPFVEIALPARKSAVEQVRFLRAQLAQIESGVVSITGFAHAFSEETPLLESLRVLNYNRENLADFPLRQIWWMPRDFTQMFRQSLPDLNSWFILKLRLDEISIPVDMATGPKEDKTPYTMGSAEGVNTSNFHATRFRAALQRQVDMETLWQLLADAVDALLYIGPPNDAIYLQEALLQEASENGITMYDSLTASHLSAHLLDKLGRIYFKEGRFDDAERLYKFALETKQGTFPEGHPEIAAFLNDLAELYRNQGRYSEAKPLYRKALRIRRAALPENHPDIATSLDNLAELYRDLAHYSRAESLYNKALRIRRAALPQGHPHIASSLNNLASLYYTQGRHTEAELLFQEALKIVRTALPQGHPDVATTVNNLAALYENQGRYSEAEPLYHEALRIDRASLPKDHPDIAIDLNNLAGLYDTQGRYSKAEPLYKEALTIYRTALPPEHPRIALSLNNLAVSYARQDRYAEAEPLSREALTIRRAALPEGHPDIAISLYNLARLCACQHRYTEAITLMNEALEILTASLGEEHPNTKTVATQYASLLGQAAQ